MITFTVFGVWLIGLIVSGRIIARAIYFEERPQVTDAWPLFFKSLILGALSGSFWPVWCLGFAIYRWSKGDPDHLAAATFGDLSQESKIRRLEARSHKLERMLDEHSDHHILEAPRS